MGMVRIPHSSTAESNKYLQEAVDYAAEKMGSDEFAVAEMMSHFLERIAFHVSCGHTITIPGFGRFGVQVYICKKKVDPLPPRPYPAFSAAIGFRNDTLVSCPCNPDLAKPIKTHRMKAHPTSVRDSGKENRRTMTAMAKFRTDLRAQKKRLGFIE